MIRRILLFLPILFALSACATEQRLEALDDTLNLYQAKFRWSNFDELLRFRKQSDNLSLDDYRRLSKIKITGYEEKQRIVRDDLSSVEQIVMISYYNKDSGREHQLLDRQLWTYDENDQTWYLVSKLPNFTP